MRTRKLTASAEEGGDVFVALCPEVDVASQGDPPQKRKPILLEAVELFFASANAKELVQRLSPRRAIETIEVAVA